MIGKQINLVFWNYSRVEKQKNPLTFETDYDIIYNVFRNNGIRHFYVSKNIFAERKSRQ